MLTHIDFNRKVGQSKISDKSLRELFVPVLAEQRRIVSTVKSLEGRLELEEAEAKKVSVLKHGLMEDLLTGHVRVTTLVDEAAA